MAWITSLNTSWKPCLGKESFIPWSISHLDAIFGFVEVLEVVWGISPNKKIRFSGFCVEPVDRPQEYRRIGRLPAVASNLKQAVDRLLRINLPVGCSSFQLLYQGELVNWLVDRLHKRIDRLDAVAASYYTTRKQSTD